MTVLVGCASAHGATRDIAERIGARLRELGYHVDVRAPGQVPDAAAYDAVVLGSAINNGAWLPEATEFVRCNHGPLTARPVYTFSVGTVGERSSMVGRLATKLLRTLGEPEKITVVRKIIRPRDHHNFAGAIAPDHYSLLGRVIFRALGGRFGDHRNWAEVDDWAERIARELAAVPGRPQT